MGERCSQFMSNKIQIVLASWIRQYNNIFLPSIQSFVQKFEIGIKRNILVTWSYWIRQFMQPLPHNWEFLDLNFILTPLWAITWNADFYQLKFEHPLTSGNVKRIECLLIEKKLVWFLGWRVYWEIGFQ